MSDTNLSIPPEAVAQLSAEAQLGSGADYQRCACIGVMPGRACVLCNNTRWLKRCTDCNGSGKIFVNVRAGSQPRADVHGRCMGRGWLPCQVADLEAMFTEANPASLEGDGAPAAAPAGKKSKSQQST